ncbi:MAG: hypothetical protein VKQ33_07680 [Candidatus Sericytochromatia bacterium]|nr:hypothetical protein [Candidatus Sericytochromatia bacterium]
MTDIRGLKPLLRLDPPTGFWVFVVGLVLLLALSLAWGLAWWRVRRGGADDATSTSAAPGPGWTTAEWLDDLASRGWMEPAQAGLFHARLASIVRAHLEMARGVPAARMTTAEAVEATAVAGGDAEAALVGRILAACDAVKFAGAGAEVSAMVGTLGEARALVAAQGNPVLGAVGRGPGAGRKEAP